MRQPRILVIHQSDEMRRGIHAILAHFNAEFIYAPDGLEGLAAAKYDQPDLVICQVELPILNGLELARMLRDDSGTQEIPLIFLHNQLNLENIKKAKELNAMAFLMRPYLDNTLIYSVKKALRDVALSNRHTMTYEEAYAAREMLRLL